MKPVMAEDERGRNWIVFEGDSAWNQCESLTKLGVTQVVLPSDVFLSGQLPSHEVGAPLDNVTPELLAASYDLKVVVMRLIRMRDCVAYLRGQEVVHDTTIT